MSTRTVAAFLIAPISFGVFLQLIWSQSGTIGFMGFALSVVIGYPLAFVIGLPVYFLMKTAGANGIISYAFMALVFAGLLIAYLIGMPVYHENDGDMSSLTSLERIRQMVFLCFGSLFSVLVFWLIARPDRPRATNANKSHTHYQ